MKKPSSVRFASTEKLLEEYIRLRPVLQKLIEDLSFDSIYSARSEAEKKKRERSFINVVRDDLFLLRVRQVHNIFRACRTYLRVFDAETSIASEFFEATRILNETLESLPLESFPEPCTEKRREILEIFENRRIGPLPGRKRIKINMISDFHITAALLDPYRTPMIIDDQMNPHTSTYMEAFSRHLRRYLSGVEMSSLSLQEQDKDAFFAEIISQYYAVRARWIEKGIIRDKSETTKGSANPNHVDRYRRSHSPILWWSTGLIFKPAHPFERKAAQELVEFAVRTLSVSPTATATERTFSLENRIHTKQRASLSKETVKKILFCQWNSRVMRRSVQRDAVDMNWEIQRQMKGMRDLRFVRSGIASASKEASEATVLQAADEREHRSQRRKEGYLQALNSVVTGSRPREVGLFDSSEGRTMEAQTSSAPEGHPEDLILKEASLSDSEGEARDFAQRQSAVRTARASTTDLQHAISQRDESINDQSELVTSTRTAIETTLSHYGISRNALSLFSDKQTRPSQSHEHGTDEEEIVGRTRKRQREVGGQ